MKEYNEVIFECNTSKVLPTQYNLFQGFPLLQETLDTNVDLEPIFEHIKSLVNYDFKQYKYVMSWLAQMFQQPHVLPGTCLIFISEEGVGKDLFSTFISSCVGINYSHNTEKLESLCGKFNSVLGGKVFITINETNPIESRQHSENIKYNITAETIAIEGKHKDPITSKNFARFVFFSNHVFAFPVDTGSRRPNIIQSSKKYLPANYGVEENCKYFTALAKVIQDKRYQKAFLEYMLSYDITTFNPKDIPKSELHLELEDHSTPPLAMVLANMINKLSDNKSFRLSTTEAYKQFKEFAQEQGYEYKTTINKFVTEMTMIFKVKKVKCSKMYFDFDFVALKKLLIEKY